jgi:hypothetical protein
LILPVSTFSDSLAFADLSGIEGLGAQFLVHGIGNRFGPWGRAYPEGFSVFTMSSMPWVGGIIDGKGKRQGGHDKEHGLVSGPVFPRPFLFDLRSRFDVGQQWVESGWHGPPRFENVTCN